MIYVEHPLFFLSPDTFDESVMQDIGEKIVLIFGNSFTEQEARKAYQIIRYYERSPIFFDLPQSKQYIGCLSEVDQLGRGIKITEYDFPNTKAITHSDAENYFQDILDENILTRVSMDQLIFPYSIFREAIQDIRGTRILSRKLRDMRAKSILDWMQSALISRSLSSIVLRGQRSKLNKEVRGLN